MKNKTLLVTGGLGYLGGRLARHFLEKGMQVRLGSRASGQPIPEALSGCEVWQMDLLDKDSISKALTGVDYVVHLAAMNAAACASDPMEAVSVNIGGTVNLLRAVECADVSRFIYFSTAHVYGAPLTGVIDEQVLTKPVHPYAITHRAAEDFVLAASGEHMQSIVVRLSNAVGAPVYMETDCWMLVINDLVQQAFTDGCLTIRSSGTQQRDFVSISDVGRAVEHLLVTTLSNPDDWIFNLGGDASFSIRDVAELVALRYNKKYGKELDIVSRAPLPDEKASPFEYRMDKLKSTGFKLTGSLSDEIDGLIDFYQKYSQ